MVQLCECRLCGKPLKEGILSLAGLSHVV